MLSVRSSVLPNDKKMVERLKKEIKTKDKTERDGEREKERWR